MKRKDFASILKDYLEGRLSGKMESVVERWFDTVGKDEPVKLLDENEEADLQARYQQAIKERIYTPSQFPRRIAPWKKLAVAASITMAAAVAVYLYRPDAFGLHQKSVAALASLVNPAKTDTLITLADGSTVLLTSGSELKYFVDISAGTRDVYLMGAAFFNVAHNRAKPFMVHTGNITTKVLGTSFRVEKNPHSDALTVSVKTGRVSVFEDLDKETMTARRQVILTPNQKVIYRGKDNALVSQLVEAPQWIPEVEEKYAESIVTHFDQAPVIEVFRSIEKLYGVPLVYDAAQFSKCTITTSLESGNLYDRLAIVCEVLNASYRVEGMTIRLTGKGCETINP